MCRVLYMMYRLNRQQQLSGNDPVFSMYRNVMVLNVSGFFSH